MPDPAIVAAYIGGAFALGAAVVGAIATRAKVPKLFKEPTKNPRYAVLTGTWRGVVSQLGLPDHTIVFKISADANSVKGSGEIGTYVIKQDDQRPSIPVIFEGSYFDDMFLKLEYKHEAVGRRGYGIIVFKLDNLGTELEGRFAGCGLAQNVLVGGAISLKKENS